jgi:hypothetical protein
MTSFFRFVNKRAIYRLGIISLAPLHVTDFPVVNVHVDELSSARIWQSIKIVCSDISDYKGLSEKYKRNVVK